MKKKIFVFIGVLLLVGCGTEITPTPEENWDESATFVKEIIVTEDGETDGYVFRIGDNGMFGFSEQVPFVEGEPRFCLWYFWGDKNTLTKPFKVIGLSKETGKEITLINSQGSKNLSPSNGADHHKPSTIELPNSGLWKLKVYFGEELFGNIVVNVDEE